MLQANHISAASSESRDITIITDEGDKVTLSYDRQTEASYAGLKALSYQGAMAKTDNMEMIKETLMRMEAERFLYEDSQDVTVSVEGDLNEQEMADIKAAIKQIDEIMTDLIYGNNISESTKDIQDLRNLESLSSIEAEYSWEREVLIEHYEAKELKTVSEYKSPERRRWGRHQIGHGGLARLIEKMAEPIEDTRVKPHRFINPLRRLFAEISHRLDDNHPDHGVKQHAVSLIESELMKKIESMSFKEQGEATLFFT